jgi:hypothetical protein
MASNPVYRDAVLKRRIQNWVRHLKGRNLKAARCANNKRIAKENYIVRTQRQCCPSPTQQEALYVALLNSLYKQCDAAVEHERKITLNLRRKAHRDEERTKRSLKGWYQHRKVLGR